MIFQIILTRNEIYGKKNDFISKIKLCFFLKLTLKITDSGRTDRDKISIYMSDIIIIHSNDQSFVDRAHDDR